MRRHRPTVYKGILVCLVAACIVSLPVYSLASDDWFGQESAGAGSALPVYIDTVRIDTYRNIGRYSTKDPTILYAGSVAVLDSRRISWGEFVTVCTDMLAKNPRDAHILCARARAYIFLKQPDKALADFQRAIWLKPEILKDICQERAVAYFNAQQFDKAIIDYTTYFTANGAKSDPVFYNYRGLAYLANYGQTKADADARAALADFDRYIAANPDKNTDGYVSRGDAHAALKVYDRAASDYTVFLATHPFDTYTLGARGRAYMELKKYTEAVADYKRLIQLTGEERTARINLGIALLQSDRAQKAITILSGVIGDPPRPSDKIPLTARAQAYVATNNWAEAVKDYDSILKVDPNEVLAYFNRGVAESHLNQYYKAIQDFQNYLKSNPKETAPAYQGLGNAYMNLKKYPEAVEAFTKFIAANPKDATALYNRGAAYYNIATASNDKVVAVKAEADLYAYLATMPTDKKAVADANNLIADLAELTGKDPFAPLNAAIQANSGNATALLNRGVYYINRTRPPEYDKAIADFTAAATLDSKDPTILYDRATAYLGKKDYASAIKDCTAALALKLDYADALATRADAYWYKEDFEKAGADYEQAFATKPEIQYAILGAGAYSKMGDKLMDPDTKAAAVAYDKAIALYDKAIGTAIAGKPTKEIVDAYYNKGVTLEKKFKADENPDDLKRAVEAYIQYLALGRALTPPITDAADVQKQIESLKPHTGDL